MFRILIGWDKSQIPINIAIAVFDVVFELNVVGFVTALTYCLENNMGIKSILLVTAGVATVEFMSVLLNNSLECRFKVRQAETNRKLDILLAEKIMNMDFDLIEGSLGREKYQKAKNTLTYDGLYNFIDYYRFLFRGIIFIAVYGTVTIKLNPWLILVLTGLEALKLVSMAVENRLINKTKDPLAKVDRKLNYINRTSRDFAIGKDIRIFKLRNYLMKMTATRAFC